MLTSCSGPAPGILGRETPTNKSVSDFPGAAKATVRSMGGRLFPAPPGGGVVSGPARRHAVMRIGFILGRGDLDQVAAMLLIAERLTEIRPDWSVYVGTLSAATGDEVARLQAALAAGPRHLRLKPQHMRFGERSDPRAVLREADMLVSLDAVVAADAGRFHGHRRDPGARRHILVSIGADAHDPADIARWEVDHVLVAGKAMRERLIAAGFPADGVATIGSPTLDLPMLGAPFSPADGRPLILYCPHHAPDRSSWPRWGRAILDWIAGQDDYRLILAPDPGLFARRIAWRGPGRLPRLVRPPARRHFEAPNLHIDLSGSMMNMRAYLESADIYLGDAGGQLDDFLARPRPCAFLNAQDARPDEGDPRYSHWRAGHVVDHIGLLGEVLDTTRLWHEDVYRPVQHAMFAERISTSPRPASQRAAAAIAELLEPAAYANQPEMVRV